MFRARLWSLILAVAGNALPVAAQPAPFVAGRIAAAETCEIHAWPAPPVDSVTQGAIWNETTNQAFDPDRGGRKRPQALSLEAQVAHLEATDLAVALGMPAARTIVHAEPLSRQQAMMGRTRLAPAQTPCVVEVIVSRLYYGFDTLGGRNLRSLILFRQFGEGAEAVATYSTMEERNLAVPLGKGAEPSDAAEAEVRKAYAENLSRALERARTAPDAKGRRRLMDTRN